MRDTNSCGLVHRVMDVSGHEDDKMRKEDFFSFFLRAVEATRDSFSERVKDAKIFLLCSSSGVIRSSGFTPNSNKPTVEKKSLQVEKKVFEDTIAKNQVYEVDNDKLKLKNTSLLKQLS